MQKFTKLGEQAKDGEVKNAWQLDVSEHLSPVDPHTYFQTSGEAIAKTEKLISDISEQLKSAKKLKKKLEKVKANNKYLETEWVYGKLVLKIKNTRKGKKK